MFVFGVTVKDAQSLQSEEEEQQDHIQDQIVRRVRQQDPCSDTSSNRQTLLHDVQQRNRGQAGGSTTPSASFSGEAVVNLQGGGATHLCR